MYTELLISVSRMFSRDITESKRAVLLIWMFEVAYRFNYRTETTYLMV